MGRRNRDAETKFSILNVGAVDMCMVFEVLGHNLLKPIMRTNYKGLPIPAVKWITKQVPSSPAQ